MNVRSAALPRRSKEVALTPAAEPAAEGLRALLGPAPLLEGEDPAGYKALHDRIVAAVEPKDALEEIWTRDFVDLSWEVLRFRRLKAALMKAAAGEGLVLVLDSLSAPYALGNPEVAADWMRREPAAVRQVDSKLTQAGLTRDAIAAQTLAAKLETFEKLDRVIMQAESRRNAAVREIDRHREALAQRMRTANRAIEDADFTEVVSNEDAAE